jgi:hypothetical protein
VTTAYGFLGADTLDKGESADASNRDTYVADPLQRTGIELVTNNPLTGISSEHPMSIKLRTTDNCIKQSV